jgi:hypothetical protein
MRAGAHHRFGRAGVHHAAALAAALRPQVDDPVGFVDDVQVDHMMTRKDVWITRRVDIARHWHKVHPYPGKGLNE